MSQKFVKISQTFFNAHKLLWGIILQNQKKFDIKIFFISMVTWIDFSKIISLLVSPAVEGLPALGRPKIATF